MIKTTMTYKKSTKGTHIYEDTREGAPIKTLYIQRDGLPQSPEIKVTVEPAS